MKKAMLLLLSALLLTGSTACGSAGSSDSVEKISAAAPDESQTTEAETEAETSPYAEMGDNDFEGAVFTILDANSHPDFHTNIPGDTMTGDAVNDALLTRNIAVEERFNIDIVCQSEKSGGVDKMKKSVLAGDDSYSMILTTMIDGLASSATAHVLYNLRELPYISLGEAWWSPLFTEALNLKGAQYYAASDLAPGIYSAPCCMFLNLKLYEDYGLDTDIYQLVLDGKWTLDELDSLTKGLDVDINGDGAWDTENDFYGIAMQPTIETTYALMYGAGVSLTAVSSDGTSLNIDALDDAKTISVVEKVTSLARNIPYKDINDVINNTFKSDRALFLQHKLESAKTHLRDMESDYLILPDPKADESQEHYISFVSGYVDSFVGIPATAEPEQTGFIAETLARYSNEYIRPLAYDTVYKDKVTRDPRSADVLDILFNNLYIDFAAVYNFASINDSLTNVVFKDAPYASTIEKKRDAVNAAIEKFAGEW